MVSRSFARPQSPKASFSDLRAFAGVCGRFAGNSGRGKRETVPILKSHKNIGALVVLGDFTKKNIEIYEKQVKAENYQEINLE